MTFQFFDLFLKVAYIFDKGARKCVFALMGSFLFLGNHVEACVERKMDCRIAGLTHNGWGGESI